MFEKGQLSLPQTVEEAAELLISDLLIKHMTSMMRMTKAELAKLHEKVAPYLLEEFRIWTGNEALLQSCMEKAGESQNLDPAIVILQEVHKRVLDIETTGIVIICPE